MFRGGHHADIRIHGVLVMSKPRGCVCRFPIIKNPSFKPEKEPEITCDYIDIDMIEKSAYEAAVEALKYTLSEQRCRGPIGHGSPCGSYDVFCTPCKIKKYIKETLKNLGEL